MSLLSQFLQMYLWSSTWRRNGAAGIRQVLEVEEWNILIEMLCMSVHMYIAWVLEVTFLMWMVWNGGWFFMGFYLLQSNWLFCFVYRIALWCGRQNDRLKAVQLFYYYPHLVCTENSIDLVCLYVTECFCYVVEHQSICLYLEFLYDVEGKTSIWKQCNGFLSGHKPKWKYGNFWQRDNDMSWSTFFSTLLDWTGAAESMKACCNCRLLSCFMPEFHYGVFHIYIHILLWS